MCLSLHLGGHCQRTKGVPLFLIISVYLRRRWVLFLRMYLSLLLHLRVNCECKKKCFLNSNHQCIFEAQVDFISQNVSSSSPSCFLVFVFFVVLCPAKNVLPCVCAYFVSLCCSVLASVSLFVKCQRCFFYCQVFLKISLFFTVQFPGENPW
jgi:hypothetical protein